MKEQRDWDVRTTPKWLQPLGILLLGSMTLYFLVGFHYVFRDRTPGWTAFATWSMFSVGGWGNSEVEAYGVFDGEKRPIDMPSLFPANWGSGYRWSRSGVKRNKQRMAIVAASTCRRHPDQPDRVIFDIVNWTKVRGSLERKNPVTKQIIDWDCSNSVRLPGGRRLLGTKRRPAK